jgi:hypothetical protein
MKKTFLITLCLAHSLQTFDQLPRFSSFIGGVTTSALIGGIIYLQSTPKETIEKKTLEMDPSFILEKKSKLVTQDRSFLLTPTIQGILTQGNVDVRVVEGSQKDQVTIISNEYFIGDVETFNAGNLFKIIFDYPDKNCLHKPVINIFVKNYLSIYRSSNTSRLEITSDNKNTSYVKELDLSSHDESILYYKSQGGSQDNAIWAANRSKAYVSKQNGPNWRRSFSSAELYIDNVLQK